MSNINRTIPQGKLLLETFQVNLGFGWEFSGKMGFSLEGVSSLKLKQLLGMNKCQ